MRTANPFEPSSALVPRGPVAPAAEPDGEFHLAEYLEKLRRRWKIVVAVVALALGLGAFHTFTTDEVYQAQARIQIERRSLSPIASAQSPWLENWWNMEYYPTQYELLRSRGLAERVAIDMGLPESQAQGRTDPDTLGQLANGLLGGLSIVPVRSTQLVDIIYRNGDPQFAADAANAFAQAYIDWGITTRSDTAGRASTFLTSQIDEVKNEITKKDAELQRLSRRTEIVSLDRESNVDLQRLENFTQEMSSATAERIAKEAALREILASPPEEVAERVSGGRISEIDREIGKLETQYSDGLQKYKPEYREMVELKGSIDSAKERRSRLISDNVDKAAQIARAELQTAQRREQGIGGQVSAARSALLDQNSVAAEYANLNSEIDGRRKLLSELLQRQNETDVTANLQGTRESNIRVVDRAMVPGGAVQPSLRNDLSRALLFGLLAGLGLAFLLDYMDRTVKTADEIERRFGLPNLAVIPDVSSGGRTYGKGSYGYGYGAGPETARPGPAAGGAAGTSNEKIELLPHDRPRLAVSEAYRSLRTALLLSSAQELRVVAVTSASAGEGKTATSVNLSIVMAQLGRRVLLIDGDLRKPRLHEVFGVSNRTGLVNILAGGEEPDHALTLSSVPNLSLIPSGPIPPNPSELLASDRMRELVRRARSRFDFVVIDTPPVLAVTDATLIGSLADGVVLCLRAGKVLREEARACRDRLLMSEVKILGTVLNRHRESGGVGGRRYLQYEAYANEAPRDSSVA